MTQQTLKRIELKPIGIIRSPYSDAQNMPIQGRFKDEVEACAELLPEYEDGLRDLDGFTHAILLYHFHACDREELLARPLLEQEKHGIFAIRSPYRPNHIGLSIVKIKKIEGHKLYFTEVDVFDQTPLIDIKPYVKQFDHREHTKSGWIDKHFEGGQIPEGTILKA